MSNLIIDTINETCYKNDMILALCMQSTAESV